MDQLVNGLHHRGKRTEILKLEEPNLKKKMVETALVAEIAFISAHSLDERKE